MDSPDKLPLVKRSFRMLVDAAEARGSRVDRRLCGLGRHGARADARMRTRTASSPRSTGCRPAARPRAAKASARPTSWREAEFRPQRRQPRDPGDRRRFQCRHHRSECARSISSRANATSGVFLSVLGFGGGNYNDLLMQKLAQAGNGVAAYIDTAERSAQGPGRRDVLARSSRSPRT